MKKLIYFLAALMYVCSCTSDSDKSGDFVWTEDSSAYPAWKGESKSYRADFVSETRLEGLTLNVSDLRSGFSKIPSSAVKASFMAYTMADVLDTTRFGQCGQRPQGTYDSLLVADIIDIVPRVDVEAKTVQPVWVKISVPRNAKAGKYTGSLSLSDKEGHSWTLPVKLDVADEVLPEPKDWKFHLDLWQNPYSVARYHGLELWSQEHFDAMRPVMQMLADAGQKVVTATILDRPWNGQTEDAFGSMVRKTRYADGRWEYDFTVFDRWVEFMFSLGIDKQINCYSMIPWKLSFDYINGENQEVEYVNAAPGSKEYAYYWDNFIRAFAEHLKGKGWFEKTMIAMDERSPEDMLLALDIIRSADPEFRVSLAGNYHPELEDIISDYSLAIRQDFPEEVLAKRKSKGFTNTIYTCCAEAKPNLFVVSEPQEAVWLGIYTAANGYDGYLRWAYNSWTTNPLKDARFRTWPAGDCFVVYPEGRSSVHFEKLIEGIQDFEKIRILKERWESEGNTEKLSLLNNALSVFTMEGIMGKDLDKDVAEVKSLL